MNDSSVVVALPYQEPSVHTILIVSSFLILLNIINHALDSLIYCGLVGQVLIGVAFGTPGAKWLDKGTEQAIVQFGYLGLILLVYEGGLNTNFNSLKANAGLSVLVALTGICLPIAFAFCLRSLASATLLQAFAAGAALCSTSLGTTFTILNTSGLTNTRLGTVLTSAAMMDDIVGLVLVQVISKLGSGPSSFHAITVVRPVFVSIGLALFVVLICRYLAKPVSSLIGGPSPSVVMRAVRRQPHEATLIAHTALLFGIVAAASYAGTSNLFAAYLAGASISWYDYQIAQPGDVEKSERMEVTQSMAIGSVQQAAHNENEIIKDEKRNDSEDGTDRDEHVGTPVVASTQAIQESDGPNRKTEQAQGSLGGVFIYEKFIQQPVARVLKPFFFASIGFSIPVTSMFTGAVIWRGIVFTILMLIGKLVTGIWLIRVAAPFGIITTKIKAFLRHLNVSQWNCLRFPVFAKVFNSETSNTTNDPGPRAMPGVRIALTPDGEQGPKKPSRRLSQSASVSQLSSVVPTAPQADASPTKSRSLYPASIVGTAMMARGEIGFLVAALAESTRIFASHSDAAAREEIDSNIYLLVIWAVVLCTVIGPISVGSLVRRVNKLQRLRREHGGGEDPLGKWGVL